VGLTGFILNYLKNPALPKVLIVTPAVYPHFVDFSGKLFFAIKVDSLNIDLPVRPARNIPVVLPSSQIKIYGKLVQGFMSYDLKNKQTNTQ